MAVGVLPNSELAERAGGALQGSEEERLGAFPKVRDEIRNYLREFAGECPEFR